MEESFALNVLNKLDSNYLSRREEYEPRSLTKMTKGEQQLILEAAFSAVCDNIMANQMQGKTDMWLQLSIDDKLLQFASFLSHMRKDYRLGAIVGVYVLFKNNMHHTGSFSQRLGDGTVIGHEITKVILEEVFSSLTEFKNQDPLLIKCELEVIGLFGENKDIRSPQRLAVLKNLLSDQEAII